jgi:hypothetical protein
MDKKTIFLELPCEIIDRIDNINTLGDRSLFVSDLLQKQLNQRVTKMKISDENIESEEINEEDISCSSEIIIKDSNGESIGRFDINSIEDFQVLAEKLCNLSENPQVRMRARLLR